MKKTKIMALVAAMVMAFSLTACSTDVEKDNPVTDVIVAEKIEISDIEINATDKDVAIEYTLVPVDAEGEVTFVVADEAIATVTDGKISAVAEGETQLTVSVDAISETVKVVVKAEDVTHGEDPEDKADVSDKKDEAGENVKPVESEKPAPTPEVKPTSKPVETPAATPTPEVKPEETAKPVATPTPEAPKPTEAPVATPAPTPEPPKCGAVGHSVDGTCSVCGSSYTTPVATPAPTPVPTPPPAVTCPICGSSAHAEHPIGNKNDDFVVEINPGDDRGDNPEWE
ncbi:MAG: hypothetical protein IKU15_02610 [Clostridia bacterium]|nr:hypothetical protein [Clostridia bacterium]